MACFDPETWYVQEVNGTGVDKGRKGYMVVGPGTVEYLRKYGTNQQMQPFAHRDAAENALRIARLSYECGVNRVINSDSVEVTKYILEKFHNGK